MLFIDDDQPEIGVRQEQRRARADHDLHLVRRHRRPGARALARRQFRMPFRRAHAEARGEAVEELRGERDLRHQDQRLAAAPDGLRHRLEIDLGLARAGDAVEQRRRKSRLARRSRAAHRRRRAGRARSPAWRNPDRAAAPPAPAAAPPFPACLRRSARRSRRRRRRPRARRRPWRASGRRANRLQHARARRVMRCGGGPASRTPTRSRPGPRCSPMRSAMRSTMPRAAQRVVGDPVDELAQLRP